MQSQVEDGLEEGECSFLEDKSQGSKKQCGDLVNKESLTQHIDNKIKTFFNSFQSYFDQKFQDMSKVMELEKKLADNQRHLEELKARGIRNKSKGIEIVANSEITVYRNAVEKKRDSSSSEDLDLIDTSDEYLDQIAEKQMQNDRRSIGEPAMLQPGTLKQGGNMRVVKE